MEYTVKALAQVADITVRTLHHYDKIGLLKPNRTSDAGYRIYTDAELDTLQQILFFKELDFSLDEIRDILQSPDYNRLDALSMHRSLLEKEKARLEKLINTIDRCITEEQGGEKVDMNDKFNGLSKAEIEAYKEEAKEKWGHEVVEASWKRMEDQGINDYEALQKSLEEIFKPVAALMDKEVSDTEVQDLMAKLKEYMNQFYDCTDEIFVGLGEMYVADERFHKNISKYGVGLPEYLREAMKYYVENK